MRLPIPLSVCLAMAGGLVVIFVVARTTAILLLMFAGLVCSGEGSSLLKRQLLLPCANEGIQVAVVSIAKAHTTERGAKLQSTYADDMLVVQVLQHVLGVLPPQAILCLGGQRVFN
mmetsp:Transcript_71544/g.232538  ORF Transcript_71544/g.232538 Transcript_71544/m.232538 type:complete len:116 (+) Transcript_71544:880-1227(+)